MSRSKPIFDELEVKKKTYVGGEQVISHAGMKCNRVEELDDVYRCYFKEEEDGIEIENQVYSGISCHSSGVQYQDRRFSSCRQPLLLAVGHSSR